MLLDTPCMIKLDLVINRRRSLPNVLSTLSHNSADCDTDHTLVCSRVRLQPKKLKTSSPHKHCHDFWLWASAQIPEGPRESPRGPLGQDATSGWYVLREAIHPSAMSAFGREERPSRDWFNASLWFMEPLFEAKRQTLLNFKKNHLTKLWQHSPLHAMRLKALPNVR